MKQSKSMPGIPICTAERARTKDIVKLRNILACTTSDYRRFSPDMDENGNEVCEMFLYGNIQWDAQEYHDTVDSNFYLGDDDDANLTFLLLLSNLLPDDQHIAFHIMENGVLDMVCVTSSTTVPDDPSGTDAYYGLIA